MTTGTLVELCVDGRTLETTCIQDPAAVHAALEYAATTLTEAAQVFRGACGMPERATRLDAAATQARTARGTPDPECAHGWACPCGVVVALYEHERRALEGGSPDVEPVGLHVARCGRGYPAWHCHCGVRNYGLGGPCQSCGVTKWRKVL